MSRCIEANHQVKFIRDPAARANRPFEPVQLDSCGLIGTPLASWSGSRRLILYKDNYHTRRTATSSNPKSHWRLKLPESSKGFRLESKLLPELVNIPIPVQYRTRRV